MHRISTWDRAKAGPPPAKAVWIEPPIGTDAAVATRKIARTVRELPDTAFAAQWKLDHAAHMRTSSNAARPVPRQVGSCTSR